VFFDGAPEVWRAGALGEPAGFGGDTLGLDAILVRGLCRARRGEFDGVLQGLGGAGGGGYAEAIRTVRGGDDGGAFDAVFEGIHAGDGRARGRTDLHGQIAGILAYRQLRVIARGELSGETAGAGRRGYDAESFARGEAGRGGIGPAAKDGHTGGGSQMSKSTNTHHCSNDCTSAGPGK